MNAVKPAMDEIDEAGLISRLLRQHRSVEDQLESVVASIAAGSKAVAAEQWQTCQRDLLVNLSFEENRLVPILLRGSPRAARTVAAEHKHLRARVVEIQSDFAAARRFRLRGGDVSFAPA